MRSKIAIVGAGLGGLATALRLSHLGHGVTVFGKTDQVGGRNRRVTVDDCEFDGGPTLLMMLDPFRKLFSDVGERLEECLQLQLCDPSYRVFYSGGERLDGTTDVDRMISQMVELGAGDDADRYPHLLRDLRDLYQDAIPNFVEKNFYSPLDFFGPRQLGLVAKHGMLSNMAKRIARYVKDPRLQMLFTFQAMYLGLSPFDAPWVYATLTYMEYGEGIWYPKGGIVEIARVIAQLAEARGATIRLEAPVASFEGGQVRLVSGEVLSFDAVVCGADLPYAQRELEGQSHGRKLKYSCSTTMFYLDYEGSLPDLLHHNVFFGSDFNKNLNQIFHQLDIPDDPAFYAAVSARSDSGRAPDGHENLYVLVPCPNLERPWTEADTKAIEDKVFGRLHREVGFEQANLRGIQRFTPSDWRDTLNLDRGAAFGISHHFLQSAYFRPANYSKAHPGVYYVGASTAPGNGMPMVLISADLAVQRMARDGRI